MVIKIYLLGCNAVYSIEINTCFRDLLFALFSILNIGVIFFAKICVDFSSYYLVLCTRG
jgi:hypothetical protein